MQSLDRDSAGTIPWPLLLSLCDRCRNDAGSGLSAAVLATPQKGMEQSSKRKFVIHELPERVAIVRMDPQSVVPRWVWTGPLAAVVRTVEELSIVCDQKAVPDNLGSDRDWVALKLEGPLKLSLTGVLASLLGPLASQSIPVFVVSTFDTDYILVKADQAQRAKEIFQVEGHELS